MNTVSFSKDGFKLRNENAFFISGEFHYFRVPKEEWRKRMRMFREAGGNTLATYVPWLIHEPEEGTILFDDVPYRDLTAFLRTAKEEGLQVVLRPGPYSYSELINSGMPCWLVDDNDELMAIFHETCEKHGIIHDIDECFQYLHELPERYEQIGLF